MELRAFAEAILRSSALSDKLIEPDGLTDERPGDPIDVPTAPARSAGLSLGRGKLSFPKTSALHRDVDRGLVLHFFANHELLAMELMALTLLRFVDAPSKFRRTIAQTILDEQKHLRLYNSRMEALGVGLGDVPVNDFFWKHIADVPTPIDFVARMSLTLEQANLDFCLFFERAFRDVEDTQTASILREVFEDEIVHVRQGLRWFRRWKPSELSDWDAYCACLSLPFTPRRAKGQVFDRESRRRAGFDERFIEALSVYSHSRGRPPAVFFFNPGCELELANGRPSYTPSESVAALTRDLAPTLAFVAKEDDVLIVPRRPSLGFLERLNAAGFALPELLEIDQPSGVARALSGRTIAEFRPWGPSPRADRFNPIPEGRSVPRHLFEKTWAAELRSELDRALGLELPDECRGSIARDREGVAAAIEQRAGRTLLIKAPLSTAGQDRITTSGVLDERQSRWVDRMLQRQGALLIEPKLDRVLDLGVRLSVGHPRPVRGIRRFVTDPKGRYLGHILHRPELGLAETLRRALHDGGQGRSLLETLEACARWLADRLEREGLVGPAGFDALVYARPEGSFGLQALVEINPRLTMAHVAAALEDHVAAGSVAIWVHLDADRRPPREGVITEDVRGRRTIRSGVLPTNDPDQATRVISWLSVGSSIEHCLAALGLEDDPSWQSPQNAK